MKTRIRESDNGNQWFVEEQNKRNEWKILKVYYSEEDAKKAYPRA